MNYYAINEETARRASEMNSFEEYKAGSATAQYRHMIDVAVEIAENQKRSVDSIHHAQIDSLLDTYARKLADNLNKGYEIDCRVPSILIAGAANFPIAKKQKQNAARDKNMAELKQIQALLEKIRSTGKGGISSDDPDAVEKLKAKLAKLESFQQTMKDVNAYYRKHKMLDGCPHIPRETIVVLKQSMANDYEKKPYASWALANNNNNIRRIKERIIELEKRQSQPAPNGWQFQGGEVVINTDINRIQIILNERPAPELKQALKSSGFRWAPSQGAWQRQLTDNAIYSAKKVTGIF